MKINSLLIWLTLVLLMSCDINQYKIEKYDIKSDEVTYNQILNSIKDIESRNYSIDIVNNHHDYNTNYYGSWIYKTLTIKYKDGNKESFIIPDITECNEKLIDWIDSDFNENIIIKYLHKYNNGPYTIDTNEVFNMYKANLTELSSYFRELRNNYKDKVSLGIFNNATYIMNSYIRTYQFSSVINEHILNYYELSLEFNKDGNPIRYELNKLNP